MCGIVGFVSGSNQPPSDESQALLKQMAAAIGHRGPDDSGAWYDREVGVGLGHARLAVLDLSPAGHQPMRSACERYVIVFNGEIYNHLSLRAALAKEGGEPEWRGHSDTETLLACVSRWGVERTLVAAVGMFAFALWDRAERTLTLARDRLGEKPLYYGWQGRTLLFASELAAMRVHPDFDETVDRNALTQLLRFNYIPAPLSVYRGVAKLGAGQYLVLRWPMVAGRSPAPRTYWSVNGAVAAGRANPFEGGADAAIDALEGQLRASIRGQMLSDVPIGAFLSGGVDSSAIVALMQSESCRPVRTFTIGFNESEYDEAVFAKAIARHLGTDHTELIVRPADALAVVDQLPSIYSEPFADSSQIPTFLVSQLARAHVTVALTGDAGDELFGGYNRYLFSRRMWRRLSNLPAPVRRVAARILRGVPPSSWDLLFERLSPILPARLKLRTPGVKAHKLASVLEHTDEHAFYRQLVSVWTDPSSIVLGGCEPPTPFDDPASWPDVDSFEHWMMATDARTYLSDDILVKVDRAAMANSLEARVPMLDHRVVELAWRMPLAFKIHDSEGKWLLRQVLYRQVPRELIERPKMGFGIPLGDWLRGPLRGWAEDLLDESRLRREGYVDPLPIRALWRGHLSGHFDWSQRLWSILMFQAWLGR